MKQLFNDSIKNFNRLMVNMGKQFLFALIYISLGVGYVGVITGKSPAELISGRQDVLIALLFASPIVMAILVTAFEPAIKLVFDTILGGKKDSLARDLETAFSALASAIKNDEKTALVTLHEVINKGDPFVMDSLVDAFWGVAEEAKEGDIDVLTALQKELKAV